MVCNETGTIKDKIETTYTIFNLTTYELIRLDKEAHLHSKSIFDETTHNPDSWSVSIHLYTDPDIGILSIGGGMCIYEVQVLYFKEAVRQINVQRYEANSCINYLSM